jgi:hypothetical protein
VVGVEQWAEIRRLYFVRRLSVKEIVRRPLESPNRIGNRSRQAFAGPQLASQRPDPSWRGPKSLQSARSGPPRASLAAVLAAQRGSHDRSPEGSVFNRREGVRFRPALTHRD